MNKKIKVDFASFWPNFQKKDNYFYHLLSTKYNVEITPNKPDLLLYSVDYSNKKEHYDANYIDSKKIFFTGENISPDFNFCDGAFSFINNQDQQNYRLPLWALFINWFNVPYKKNRDQSYLIPKDRIIKTSEIKKRNKHFCSFLASNPSGERLNFAPLLNNIKEIDSRGKIFNNTGKNVKGRGDQKWKIKYLSKYRFNISFENEIGNGYVTEKILHPMSVNSIPIYWGSKEVLNDFNENSFIYVNNFKSYELAIKKIIELENNEDLYLDILNKPWLKDNKYPHNVLPENVINFIEEVLG